MKLLMHILKKNEKLGIDNRIISTGRISRKLQEEHQEVQDALLYFNESPNLENLKEIMRETFDLIQMCILILWRCHKQAKDMDQLKLIQEINFEHKEKIISREWIIETGIEIDIKE